MFVCLPLHYEKELEGQLSVFTKLNVMRCARLQNAGLRLVQQRATIVCGGGSLRRSPCVDQVVVGYSSMPLCSSTRHCATQAAAASAGASATRSNIFDRTAAARRDIHELWAAQSNSPSSSEDSGARHEQVAALIERYQLGPTAAKEDDITRNLGEAFDRLLLLCVPLGEKGAACLELLLTSAGRTGREVGIRTIQHLFSRSASYAEAIAIFYTLRRCNVNMNMESYYAMLYSLQRLEEESWALKFSEELEQTKGVSEQGMDFILQGCANQLLPENKPWIGNVMYSDGNGAAPQPSMRATQEEYDRLGEKWTARYKEGATAGFVRSQQHQK